MNTNRVNMVNAQKVLTKALFKDELIDEFNITDEKGFLDI
jgi:hypothetical protein